MSRAVFQVMFDVKLGHIQLKVSDLQCAMNFYCNVLGMHIVEVVEDQFAFLSFDDSHHRIALQSIGRQAPAPHSSNTGLHHIAFEVPDRRSFVAAYDRLNTQHVSVEAVNHLISLSLYFRDPDGNGLEIYWDTRCQSDGSAYWRGRSYTVRGDTLSAQCQNSTIPLDSAGQQ